jgi:hypothetical protein
MKEHIKGSQKGLKSKGKSNKTQGISPETGSKADTMQEPQMEQRDRGMGSEFANSVANAMNQAKDLKGSANSFLGVEKVVIDPKEFAHSLLNKK